MSQHLPDNLLCRLSHFVSAQMGLHFPRERWRDLERGIQSAARQLCFTEISECVESILSSHLTRQQVEVLASHLTVGETYFFRDKNLFDALEREILPEIIHKRRGTSQRLRIWSAGCCTGEEAYTIAMIVRKILPDLAHWNITILATDINPQFLQKAAVGIYKEWSFRGTPGGIRERWFEQTEKKRYQLRREIREMVTFSYLNLAEDGYPALLNNTNAMDVILCRNVLMYFSPEQAGKVVGHFHSALLDGGWFAVSPSETFQVPKAGFSVVDLCGATLYRRAAQPSTPVSLRPEIDWTFIPAEVPEAAPPVADEETVVIQPREPTLQEQGVALYQAGHYSEAAEMLGKVIELNPDNEEAIALLARCCANDGRLEEALEWCERAILVQKMNPELHYLQATILQEQGDIQRSSVSLNRALYLDPRFVLASYALGNIALHQQNIEVANKHFGRALTLLNGRDSDDVVPASEGMTAGRLRQIIRASIEQEVVA